MNSANPKPLSRSAWTHILHEWENLEARVAESDSSEELRKARTELLQEIRARLHLCVTAVSEQSQSDPAIVAWQEFLGLQAELLPVREIAVMHHVTLEKAKALPPAPSAVFGQDRLDSTLPEPANDSRFMNPAMPAPVDEHQDTKDDRDAKEVPMDTFQLVLVPSMKTQPEDVRRTNVVLHILSRDGQAHITQFTLTLNFEGEKPTYELPSDLRLDARVTIVPLLDEHLPSFRRSDSPLPQITLTFEMPEPRRHDPSTPAPPRPE